MVGYGALLRLDALTLRYGPVDHPGWLRALQETRGRDSVLRPAAVFWTPVEGRYISDPYTYLIHAREMDHFYEASRREPVFPFATKIFLTLLQDQDVAISFASATFSVLAIFGVFLLGAYAYSYVIGLVAAAALAIEYDVITLGVSGWRDDAFTCGVVFAAYWMLRFSRTANPRDGVWLGVTAGFACLVRITSLSFLASGFLWLVATGDKPRRDRLRGLLLAVVATTVIVAPFLINCWRAYGDPFYAITAISDIYRTAAGEAHATDTGAGYMFRKFGEAPVAALDTMAVGMTSYPFLNKWQGFDLWAGWLGPLLAVLALAGLALSVFTAAGRLLLVVLIGSLLPYAVTWKLASDWRFTVHAYPFFLIAAPAGVLLISRGAGWLRQRGQPPVSRRALTFAAGWIVALAAGTWFITTGLPPRVVRETLASGQDASIMTGGRDSWFFSRGWSAPSPGVNVTTRVSRGGASDVRLPLVAGRPYRLTIRADPFPRPAEPGASLTIDVQFNGERLATLTMVFDPDRVGSASIEIPAARVRDGTNILTLQPAGQAQLELWYVRINPL